MLNQERYFKVKIDIFQRGFVVAILVQKLVISFNCFISVAEFFFFGWNYFCRSQNEQINNKMQK